MKQSSTKRYIIAIAACLLVIVTLVYIYFFATLSNAANDKYIYIDSNDDIDSVYTKLEPISRDLPLKGFKTLARHFDYTENIITGRYKISRNDCAITVLKHLKSGMQTPLSLTIPSLRTIEDLSRKLSNKLMFDSTEICSLLKDSTVCAEFGHDTCTIISIFVPNTYDVYWDVPADKFLERMYKESNIFWNADRKDKAHALNLTPTEVITLASIVDEETSNNTEKPMIAGMYYNRLNNGMPLQADPTIKFALKDFTLKRIYHKMLHIKSPYNTYVNQGLPPGPIRIPTIAGIDAVLNLTKHQYLYMCAKEDFSGTHNFAETYQEHQQNAKRYSQALNKRGVR